MTIEREDDRRGIYVGARRKTYPCDSVNAFNGSVKLLKTGERVRGAGACDAQVHRYDKEGHRQRENRHAVENTHGRSLRVHEVNISRARAFEYKCKRPRCSEAPLRGGPVARHPSLHWEPMASRGSRLKGILNVADAG